MLNISLKIVFALLLAVPSSVTAAAANSFGQVVTRFGTNGTATVDLSGLLVLSGVNSTIDDQQRILVAGSVFSNGVLVARFTPNGQLDTSFNGVGYRVFFYNATSDRGTAIALSRGIIYVGGSNNGAGGRIGFVASFNDDGSFNSQWGTNGIYPIAGLNPTSVNSIAVQDNGQLIIGGILSGTNGYVARTNTTGTGLDASFNATGTPGYQTMTGFYIVRNIFVTTNNAIRVPTSSDDDTKVYGFTSAGLADVSYNGTGVSTVIVGGVISDTALTFFGGAVMQSTGAIVVCGTINGSFNGFLARLNSSGQLDTSLGTAGIVLLPTGRGGPIILTLNDGIIIGHQPISPFGYFIVAYTSNLVVNSAFNIIAFGSSQIRSIVDSGNGNIIVISVPSNVLTLREFTQYQVSQVGISSTPTSFECIGLNEYQAVSTPVYRVPVFPASVLPEYLSESLSGL